MEYVLNYQNVVLLCRGPLSLYHTSKLTLEGQQSDFVQLCACYPLARQRPQLLTEVAYSVDVRNPAAQSRITGAEVACMFLCDCSKLVTRINHYCFCPSVLAHMFGSISLLPRILCYSQREQLCSQHNTRHRA